MYTNGQIKTWFELFETSDNKNNYEEFSREAADKRCFLKRDLIEAKVQVDRWDAVTNVWVFNPCRKEMISKLFKEELSNKSSGQNALKSALSVLVRYAKVLESGHNLKGRSVSDLSEEEVDELVGKDAPVINNNDHIWGASIYYTDAMEPNFGLGLALEKDNVTLSENDSGKMANSIVVFQVWDDPDGRREESNKTSV